MSVSKAQFIWGIRQQESGGNYTAGNPSGAMGAYQVLASNIAAWSKKALGHSISATEFLHSPANQDAIADSILGGYFDKYGPEGAASAWYSGDPTLKNSTRAQPGGPSIASYVASVMGHAAQAPAGVSLPLSGSTAAGSGGGAEQAGLVDGLLGFPAEIVGFFGKATDDLSAAGQFFYAFTQPSTWVRVGAGGLGVVLLVAALVSIGLSATKKET